MTDADVMNQDDGVRSTTSPEVAGAPATEPFTEPAVDHGQQVSLDDVAVASTADPSFEPAALRPNGPTGDSPVIGSLALLHDVDMEVTVELGRTTMPIRELLALQPGMVIEIDRAASAPIDVLVNGRLIACGEVVVIDEEFGIRITEIAATRNVR